MSKFDSAGGSSGRDRGDSLDSANQTFMASVLDGSPLEASSSATSNSNLGKPRSKLDDWIAGKKVETGSSASAGRKVETDEERNLRLRGNNYEVNYYADNAHFLVVSTTTRQFEVWLHGFEDYIKRNNGQRPMSNFFRSEFRDIMTYSTRMTMVQFDLLSQEKKVVELRKHCFSFRVSRPC